jgi:4-hydroxymandelate oxidase
MQQTETLPPTIRDYETIAPARLSAGVAAYYFGGAGDELTLAANAAAYRDLALVPRTLRALSGGSARTTLLGQQLAHPIIVAPMAYQRLLHADGERATALGAAAQDTQMTVSAQASLPLADIVAGSGRPAWFQLYWMGSRDQTLALADYAVRNGASVLVLTVDAPVQGVRDREMRTGFRLPPGVAAVNLAGFSQPGLSPLADGESILFDRIAPLQPDWEDVRWLCSILSVPILLKGILHPDDARAARDCGAAGVVVSNHGGRVLDTAVATLHALPAVVQAVPDLPVLVDGGIRRGTDVLKALALGARAVMVGRPVAAGLAVGGAHGVSHVLRLMRDEFEIAMMLCGCRTVDDIHPDLVQRKL